MTPEQYQKTSELCEAALNCPPDERPGFLDRVCADSPWLRAAVEKQLASLEEAEQVGFLDLPAPPAVAEKALRIDVDASHPAQRQAHLEATAFGTKGPPQERTDGSAEFIRDLLHRRLRVVTLIGSGLFAFFLLKDLWTGDYQFDRPQTDFLTHSVTTLGLVVLTIVLWTRRALRTFVLRAVEILVLILAVVFQVQLGVELMRMAPEWATKTHKDVLLSVEDRISLRWLVTIVLYGLYVPNTTRRCVAVVTVLAVIPLAVFSFVAAWDGVLSEFAEPLSEMAVWVAVGALLAVYGSYKIAISRRRMFEGRKLGHYEFKRLLGKGGMGEVYLTEHVLLRRPSALKVIRPERADDAKILRRFEREVRATARLNHPNVVSIYDYGFAGDGTFYYAMEYLPGLDLRELVARHGALPPGRVIHFLKQAAAALSQAHSAGLIHRDIKPNNMIACSARDNYDLLKLVDFGLVCDVERADAGDSVTQEAFLLGTPSFMSPEQIDRSREVDCRSDIYSLGAVGYFLLTGHPPFVRATSVEVMAAHLREPVIPPRRGNPEIPRDLEQLVLRCLEKDPANRFPCAGAVAESLRRCGGSMDWTGQQATAWWHEKELDPDAEIAQNVSIS